MTWQEESWAYSQAIPLLDLEEFWPLLFPLLVEVALRDGLL